MSNIRSMAWKELRETRNFCLIVLGLLVIVFACLYYLHKTDEYLIWFFGLFLLATTYRGASEFAKEIGKDTIPFLRALPISRADIWWAKYGVGAFQIMLCIFGAAFILAGFEKITHMASPLFESSSWPSEIIMLVTSLIPAQAFSVLIGTVLPRTLPAMCLALPVVFLSFLIITVYAGLERFPRTYELRGLLLIDFITVPLFLSVSYDVFTKAETLKSTQRFVILRDSLGRGLLAIGLILAICYGVLVA